MKAYIGNLFFKRRFFIIMTLIVVLFVVRFFFEWMGLIPYVALAATACLLLIDYVLLFSRKKGVYGVRTHADRFSNGDENPVKITLENNYNFPVYAEIIDEIPVQFQRRDVLFSCTVPPSENRIITYELRPVKRGEYEFGTINTYVSSPIGLVSKRYKFEQPAAVPVYPSYLQMRKYQLMAIHNRLSEIGVKKIRRIGHSMEFEHIKEYVIGDDYRTVNWKATARRSQLMVNHYTDEKSQQIYCVIDKSRVMKMPFDGLSLLDYAINASLILSNVALLKQDKAGLITFSEQISAFLPADKKASQMNAILQALYKQKTRYLESDYENLYLHIRKRIPQRSLIALFTNFESMSGLKRQLQYLRKIARHHLLLVIFFENTELKDVTEKEAKDMQGVYTKIVAEKFAYEKKLIVKELQQYGILSILSAPQNLTINAVNKYLELKTKQMI